MDENQVQLDLIKQCLRSQIDELAMLQSIFCSPGEFRIDDYSIEADINEYLEGNTVKLTSHLEYSIRLDISDSIRIDIRIALPHLYPTLELANVSILSVSFSNKSINLMRKDLEEYMQTIDKSEVYVYQLYQWLQENAIHYHNRIIDDAKEPIQTHTEMERLWIYSHHLKSKTKRQELVKLGKALNLTGFSRPGKPGIICIEGRKKDTQEYWRTIRQWNWQKITVRRSEEKSIPFGDQLADLDFRKFKLTFHEKILSKSSAADESTNSVLLESNEEEQMNMSLFMKFLEQHNCGYIKKDLFGFD